MSGSFFMETDCPMSHLQLRSEFSTNWQTLRRVRWGRAIVGGVAAELAVFAIVFPVLHFFGQTAFLVSILVASAAMPFLLALWVDKRAESQFMLHGLLVGAVAALVYLIVAWGQPEPLLYKIAHGLKLVGGLLGGFTSSLTRAGRVAEI
jgi:Na+(H+)/acetate symporter ActP